MTTVLLDHRRFRSALAEQEFKQESFAEMVGITDRHVRNLCSKDMDVAVSLCYRISTALQIPMPELLVCTEAEKE